MNYELRTLQRLVSWVWMELRQRLRELIDREDLVMSPVGFLMALVLLRC